MNRVHEDSIRAFYRRRPQRARAFLPQPLYSVTLMDKNEGLGDTVILTDLPRKAAATGRREFIHSRSLFFGTLTSFNPYYKAGITPFLAIAEMLAAFYDLGGGHVIQRLQRAYGFEPDISPRGCIEVNDVPQQSARVVLHLEPGVSVDAQRRKVHPRAREVYPETLAILQSFISHHRELAFYEVGTEHSGLSDVGDWTGLPLRDSIRRMASCQYFIGINSGPMHLAAALGLRVITIINFPKASLLYLPALKDIGIVDIEWLYPQSVLLHQEEEGELVRRLSHHSIEQAFQGDLYPYWTDRYLSLIYETL